MSIRSRFDYALQKADEGRFIADTLGPVFDYVASFPPSTNGYITGSEQNLLPEITSEKILGGVAAFAIIPMTFVALSGKATGFAANFVKGPQNN